MSTTIKARRVTGGAIVTVARPDGRVHRHHVGLRRFARLLDVLAGFPSAHGDWSRNGFDVRLDRVDGLSEARNRAAREGRRSRRRHWVH